MGCVAPALDESGWCGSNLAPDGCGKPRRYSGCDWIAISPGTAKVFVRMLQSVQNPVQFIPKVPIQIKMYRQGISCLLATYDAWQRDANGYVGFYFDEALLAQPAGYYVGDLFFGCEYCFSLKFRLAPCELIADDCRVVEQIETCGKTVCAIYPAIGEGTIGGVDCALVPPNQCEDPCGTVAPYFDDSNPNDFKFDPCQAGCDPAIPISPVGGTAVGDY